MIELRKVGKTYCEIAAELGPCTATDCMTLKGTGLEKRLPYKRRRVR